MRKKADSTKNIWDVLFSLDKHCFPVQRNYLQEPRGTLNPVNCEITSKVDQGSIEMVKTEIPNPYDLYAYDCELNYVVRKLADLVYYYDLDDLDSWQDDSNPVSEDMIYYLDSFLEKINFHGVEATDLRLFAEEMAYEREDIHKGKYDYIKHYAIEDSAKIVQAVMHVIENSDWDWKTKAEAFLRASSIRDYSTADDETIIYLMAQNLEDEVLEKEAMHRWKRYQKEWEGLYFSGENPFNSEFMPNRLRLIHWDKITCLRPFEPQLDSDPTGTCRYKSENQHLFSPAFIADYAKVFSLFRTDMNVDPIRGKLPNIIEKFYSFLAGKHDYEYNYTYTDVYYLSDLLVAFTLNRFQHDILEESGICWFMHNTRKEVEIKLKNSSFDFLTEIPMVTLVALEIFSVFYSRSSGMVKFLQMAKEWLLSKQTAYGYWYDGANNPEYTTVLVLDALNLIEGNSILSFPIKTTPEYTDNQLLISYSTSSQSEADLDLTNKTSKRFDINIENQVITFRGEKIHIGGVDNWELLMALLRKNGSPLKHEEIMKMTNRGYYEIPTRIGELKKQLIKSNGQVLVKAIKNQRNIGYYFDMSVLQK